MAGGLKGRDFEAWAAPHRGPSGRHPVCHPNPACWAGLWDGRAVGALFPPCRGTILVPAPFPTGSDMLPQFQGSTLGVQSGTTNAERRTLNIETHVPFHPSHPLREALSRLPARHNPPEAGRPSNAGACFRDGHAGKSFPGRQKSVDPRAKILSTSNSLFEGREESGRWRGGIFRRIFKNRSKTC